MKCKFGQNVNLRKHKIRYSLILLIWPSGQDHAKTRKNGVNALPWWLHSPHLASADYSRKSLEGKQMSTSRRHERVYNGGTYTGCMKRPAKVPSAVVWPLAEICDRKMKLFQWQW
jgi:hypothetical protein